MNLMTSILMIVLLVIQSFGGITMGTGSGSTLILHPDGQSDITFNLTGSASRASGGYVVPLQSLRLNEHLRLKIAYSQGESIDGGEAISSHGPLVPITFDVVVYGTSQANMIQKLETLMLAVTNESGGTLEYKPEDLGDSVRSTFYHYEQSAPPELKSGERWDRSPTSPGMYRLQQAITLQTQPFATSDPSTSVVVRSAVTIYNQNDSALGYAAITGSDVKGIIGALTQLRIKNLESGAVKAIKKLIYFRRSEGTLANFDPILEGGTPDGDSSIWWSTESDTSRRSDNYQLYAPPEAANDQWAYRTYTISNPGDHEGRAAIAVICLSYAETASVWDLKASIEIADIEVETDVKNVEQVGGWHVLLLGEVDIPPTPISDDENISPKLKIYLRRTSGDSKIAIDFVTLVYVDEYPQLVTIESGFTDSYRLLLENFKDEICHVVDESTLAFDRTANYIASLLQLKPGVDQRIYFLWERLGGLVLDDDFEDYEAWRWVKAADFESDESWGGAPTPDTTHYVEGSRGLQWGDGGGGDLSVDLDLDQEGRFSNDDFVYIAVYATGTTDITVFFKTTPAGPDNYYYTWSSISAGWNFLSAKKSDFSDVGSPDWADINYLTIENASLGESITVDDWRIVRADPDDETKGNDTGEAWDFARDVWHIYELDSTDKTLGCIDITAALEQVALIHEEPSSNIKFLAEVQAKRDDGDVGLVFRCEDGTSGSEDMAAFFIDTANDELELRKWAAGSVSDIATAVSETTAPDTDYYLGVQLITDTIHCYFGTSLADIWDADNEEFVADARVFDETDSDFASGGALESGQVGLLSIGTLGRFSDVLLYSVDQHVPGDSIEVYLPAIFRSIYPFRE